MTNLGPRRLDKGERAALLASIRDRPSTDAQALADLLPTAALRQSPSFDDLPGADALRLQKQVAERLGIAAPYYRSHDVRAGAWTEVGGKRLLNFASYDYLGLNGHAEITAAVAEAAARWGTSVSASRLTAGERPFHAALEGELARLYGAQEALLFVGGHATNATVIPTIMGPDDLIVHDVLAHNSIIVGAEMAQAQRRTFPHNDLEALDALLSASRGRFGHCLIVTEGLFSMDGDGPDLQRLIDIKRRHGAWLMIDEAHALGVLGPTGRGLAEHCGVDPADVDIWMGTLSKTLVSCGGYVAGPSSLIEHLKYSAPGMVYSVGIAPPACVAALTALDIMLREPARVGALQRAGRRFCDALAASGHDVGESWGHGVTPLILGDSLVTVLLAARLEASGILSVPVIPPGVPERSARLRFFLSSGHDAEDLAATVATVTDALDQVRQSEPTLKDIARGLLAERLGASG